MVIQILKDISQRGIKISLDDFGTGYSSLSYLLRFPIDTIKVDRSFVSHLQEDGNHHEIVRAIVALGHALGKSLVAEGIEMQEQCLKLQELNCDYGQGYLFSRPLTPQAAKDWLTPVDHLLNAPHNPKTPLE
jgi:EAL domain-containing protein (putative c-di-GMP-specific phosphodiesterase class I)